MRRSQLPQLERQLVEAARRQSNGRFVPAARPRRTTRRRALTLAVVTLVLALLSAVALAATGVLSSGVPFHDPGPPAPRLTPHHGIGVTRPADTQLLPLRVDDPAGGPPWGMRIVRTSRGVGCVQLGRVVNGRLGVIGQDGVEHDDGRFHPFPAHTVLGADDCAPLDARGRLYRSPNAVDTYASGPTAALPCLNRHCPDADERAVFYAVLGPDGRDATYLLDGQDHTIRAQGPDGVVLAVIPGHPFEGWGHRGSWGPWTFRDGRVCHDICRRPPGYVERRASRLRASDVAAPLHVTQRYRRARDGTPQTLVTVTFRTRVAITNAANEYVLDMKLDGPSCAETEDGGESASDYRRGQLVRLRFPITAGCPGMIRGRVLLRSSSATAPGDLFDFSAGRGVLVGRFSAPEHQWPKRLLRPRP